MMQKKRKKLSKKLKTIILVNNFFLLLFFSCKEDLKSSKVFKNEVVEYKFEFPDTIKVNKSYDGKIIYKGVLDTLTTSFEDKRKSRYIYFYMNKTKKIETEIKKLKLEKLDTFGAINNRIIPFYDISFNKSGVYYLDGYIEDHVIIDNKTDSKKNRYIENIVKATHKVVVVK